MISGEDTDVSAYSCEKCSREVKRREYGKCMYCGEPLPAAQRMSEEEARAAIERNHARWEDENAKPQWGISVESGPEAEWGWGDWVDAGGADGEGADGGD